MTIVELLKRAREQRCSDVHLAQDKDPVFRRDGQLIDAAIPLTGEERCALIDELLQNEQRQRIEQGEDVDFCFVYEETFRQRVNIFRRQSRLCAAIRIIQNEIPTFEQLGLPEVLQRLAMESRGLVLITGPTGSGKSTTLAAMIEAINQQRACHILTVEDPVEYRYNPKQAMINQREVGTDVRSFSAALRSSLREDPDVILVGEMRDYETISAAITAAETGHLVLSTLHTVGAANTIDRIIDVFPPHAQQQIRTQLAGVLKGVVTQQLLPRADGSGRIAAFEVLTCTDAVLSMIRDNKCFQLESVMQTGAAHGMLPMDMCLKRLAERGVITRETALEKAVNKANFR